MDHGGQTQRTEREGTLPVVFPELRITLGFLIRTSKEKKIGWNCWEPRCAVRVFNSEMPGGEFPYLS